MKHQHSISGRAGGPWWNHPLAPSGRASSWMVGNHSDSPHLAVQWESTSGSCLRRLFSYKDTIYYSEIQFNSDYSNCDTPVHCYINYYSHDLSLLQSLLITNNNYWKLLIDHLGHQLQIPWEAGPCSGPEILSSTLCHVLHFPSGPDWGADLWKGPKLHPAAMMQ